MVSLDRETDIRLRRRLTAIHAAVVEAPPPSCSGLAPSPQEIRDLIRCFVRIEDQDVRLAVLCLLRTLGEP